MTDSSGKTLATNRQRFVRLCWLLGGLLTILSCFVSYLLIRVYDSSSSLAEASLRSFSQESRTDLSILNEYFDQRISDIETLLNCRALKVYYQNKALGMRMEYGLTVAVAEITDEFERFQRNVRAGNSPVFDQIIFFDTKEKRVVAETLSSSNVTGLDDEELGKIVETLGKTSPFCVIDSGLQPAVFVFKRFTYKDQERGCLLMRLNLGTLESRVQFHGSPATDEFKGITDSRGVLIKGPKDLVGKKLFELLGISPTLLSGSQVVETHRSGLGSAKESFVVCGGKIPNTPLWLVNVAPRSKYLGGYTASLWGMVFAALVGGLAIMAIAIFKSLAEQSRTYKKLEEARDNLDIRVRERTTELAETNLQLQREINERKRTVEYQRLLATAVEQAAEGIVITDTNGTIEYVNPAFETITGYPRDEAIGQNSRLLQSGRQERKFYTELWDTIGRGEVWRGQFVNRKKDGTLYREDAVISPVKDPTGRILNYVAVKHDRTLEIELQHQLFWAQKMESIGTLAGGIAHDFNNILQVILGYAELTLKLQQQDQKYYKNAEKIYQAGKRGADLVKSLLTFGRKVEPKLRPINLNKEIVEFQSLLSRTIPKTIKIDLHLNGDLELAQADSSQVMQILMNLGVNARDAMPDGGTLTVQTRNEQLNEEYCRSHLGARPGLYVTLSVSDTGIGMDKQTLSHIFEPFFTTKEVGKGTGLGLAIVYGIVKQHAGYITCYSEPGHGTTFKIYFPAAEIGKDTVFPITNSAVQRGNETILLVDDDEGVRDWGKELLSSFGYTILTAVNGKEALEIYLTEKERISLVILDLIMPEMDGKQCLAEILDVDPNARVLISSGYPTKGLSGDSDGSGSSGFVEKPYDASQLLKMVRDVLDKR